ncbi:MAG: MORN repeat variant [Bacteroidetes bacterium ADurb.Bin408]|nr:MAG: MORN repeat variant [Bacteroidetes bacterium ADurb.Bin408]
MTSVKPILLILLLFASPALLWCQTDDEENDSLTADVPTITEYEKYNKILGGDSVRYCNGQPCKGLVKDFYPNGNSKHRGYYVDGRIETTYKNFYENGQEEREFVVKSFKTSTMVIYYPDGKKLSEIEYLLGEPVYWTDYYPDGQVEYTEKYNNSGEYILFRNFYYRNGQAQSTLTLINKKENIFEKIEYFPSGSVKEKGQMLYNRSLGDYQKTGVWITYNEKGEVVSQEHYYKNKLIEGENDE